MKTNKRSLAHPIFWLSLLDQISITIAYPLLTIICFDPHTRLFAVSTSQAVRSIWYGIFSGLPHGIAILAAPILAYLSDYIGRKKVLLYGATSAALFSFIAASALIFGNIWLMIAAGIIWGIFVRTEPVALACIGDFSTDENKMIHMGYLQLFISIGAFIGPLITAYFAQRFFFNTLNFSFPFLIGGFFGIITFWMTYKLFKETYQPPIEKKYSTFKENLKLLARKNIFKVSIILILTQISWRIYYQFMPPILKVSWHSSSAQIGIFMGLIALWLIIGSGFLIRPLKKYFSTGKIIHYSIYAMLLGSLLAAGSVLIKIYFFAKLLAWISAVPIAIGDVIAYSALSTLYSDTGDVHHQGKMMGLNVVIVSLVWTLTGFLGGLAAAANIHLPILIAPATLIILVIFQRKFYVHYAK